MQDPQMPVCTSQGQRFDSDQSVNAPSHSHPGKAVSAVRDQNAVTPILFLYFTFFFCEFPAKKTYCKCNICFKGVYSKLSVPLYIVLREELWYSKIFLCGSQA